MSGISISPVQLLIIGIPQGFLAVLGIFIYSQIKVKLRNYLILSLILTSLTYFIRFLPISIGVNTMLSMIILIISFQIIYRFDLRKIVKLIVSVVGVFLTLAVAELLNGLIINLLFGEAKAEQLVNSNVPLVKSLSYSPSNIVFAFILFLFYYFISKKTKSKKDDVGTISK